MLIPDVPSRLSAIRILRRSILNILDNCLFPDAMH